MGLRAANRPVLDSNGYATAIVTRSEFGKGTQTVKSSRDDVDVREYERLELDLATDGTTGPITMSIYAGTALNGPMETVGRGKAKKAVYNRVTSIALGLGIIEPKDVEGVIDPDVVDRVEKALLDLEGTKVQFKLAKAEGKSLAFPVPDSIRRVD